MARRAKGVEQVLSGSPNSQFTNFSPKPIIAQRAPTVNDTGFPLGQSWIDKSANNSYVLTSVVAGSASWIESTIPSDPVFDTVQANSFITRDAAAGMTISGNTITADGTDADIDVEITPKGTGELLVSSDASFVNNAVTTDSAKVTIHSGNQGFQRIQFRDETGILSTLRYGGSAATPSNALDYFIGTNEAGNIQAFGMTATEVTFGNTSASKTFKVDTNGQSGALEVDGTSGEVSIPVQLNAAIMATTDAAAGLEITLNQISAVGTDPDINLILAPKGTGDIIANVGGYEGNEFRTNTPTTSMSITGSTITATGSNANVPINLTPKASAAVVVDQGSLGIESPFFICPTAGNGIQIKEGANARMGTATLVAGTVTVNNTSVGGNTRIFLTTNAPGGTVGFLHVSATNPGVSFTITSSSGADTSEVAWLLVEGG